MRYLVPAVLLVVAGGLLLMRGVAADKPAAVKTSAALILVHDGRGKLVGVHRLTDAKQVVALEAFFPNYRDRPSSRIAAGWELGYEVYFDTGDGRSARLVVSPPSLDINVWSMSRGDLAIEGDFHKFVTDLGPPALAAPAAR